MKKSVSAVVLFCGIFFVGFAAIAEPAGSENLTAMGLKFGQTVEQAMATGLTATLIEVDDSLTIYKAEKLPQQPSTTDHAMVIFDSNHGLQKLVWYSKNFKDDVSGEAGKKQFSSVQATLNSKYGPPARSWERVGLKLYSDWDEFYQCLDYAGCGLWFSEWTGDFGYTVLSIESRGLRGEGWLELVYEGPQWRRIIDQRKDKAENEDAEAF